MTTETIKKIKKNLTTAVEILKAPEDSDEVWWCIGQIEDAIKYLEKAQKISEKLDKECEENA